MHPAVNTKISTLRDPRYACGIMRVASTKAGIVDQITCALQNQRKCRVLVVSVKQIWSFKKYRDRK